MSQPPPSRVPDEFLRNAKMAAREYFTRTTSGLYYLWDAFIRGDMRLSSFTVSTLPDAAGNERRLIYVSDETGGATVAFSDGSDWRRVQDRAVVS